MAGFLGGGYDPWEFEEEQTSSTIAASSLTDILNITGKGFLESVILNDSNTGSAVARRLKIIKDGTTVLDEYSVGTGKTYFGIVPIAALQYVIDNSGHYIGILNGNNYSTTLDGSIVYNSSDSYRNAINYPAFPSSSEQTLDFCALVTIAEPVYFSQSLQIQAQSVTYTSNYYIKVRH